MAGATVATATAIALLTTNYIPGRAVDTRGKVVAMTYQNKRGNEIDFDAAANLMDDDLRELLANDGVERDEQEFFAAYAAAHRAKYGEEFEPAKQNPIW